MSALGSGGVAKRWEAGTVGPEGHRTLVGRWRAHRRRLRKTCSENTSSELAVPEVSTEISMMQKERSHELGPRSLVDGGPE